MATWKEMIIASIEYQQETWDDIVESTLTEEQLNTEFYDDFGHTEGEPFTVWTKNRVYFPVCYDGAEWVGSVSRNPDGKATDHLGGG